MCSWSTEFDVWPSTETLTGFSGLKNSTAAPPGGHCHNNKREKTRNPADAQCVKQGNTYWLVTWKCFVDVCFHVIRVQESMLSLISGGALNNETSRALVTVKSRPYIRVGSWRHPSFAVNNYRFRTYYLWQFGEKCQRFWRYSPPGCWASLIHQKRSPGILFLLLDQLERVQSESSPLSTPLKSPSR